MLENFIPYSTQSINNDDKMAVFNALFSTHLTQGAYTQEFENAIANYIGTKHAISFNSATSALYAACYALKDFIVSKAYTEDTRFCNATNFHHAASKKTISILTTPISFVATTNMMLANGITPIFADIARDGNLDIHNLESLLRDDTIAICSVDYAGNSVERGALKAFAKKHNLIWLSDSSHAFGARYKDIQVGIDSNMAIFSFHAVKPFTTCEGGALVCESDFFAQTARLICSHGIIKETPYNHDCVAVGFNFRLHEVSAALGLSQLKRVESFLAERQHIAHFYDSFFKDNPYFSTLKIPEQNQSTYHLYPIFLHEKLAQYKEDIAHSLAEKNIGVQVHYKPIYNFSAYKHLGYKPLPHAEEFYFKELSIPCHQNMTKEQAKEVAHIILQTLESYNKK